MNNKYDVVIGLEVHIQLNTKTKIFCSCNTKFGNEPNSNVCPVCTAMPGVLPVLNREVVESAIKVGIALNCQIAERSVFSRKQYFYPDLPKNYQISQYDMPTAFSGFIELKNNKKIGIIRAHIEEDAGKLIHTNFGESLVDYNRTGVPLIEIVSEPDITSPEEAYEYLNCLKQTIKYTSISDCNMEEGSLRCDANISIMPKGSKVFGIKSEIKNLNSFKAVERALLYEIERHIEVVESGEKIIQETRLWDDKKGITISMRSKEEAYDYRYFPEPDLPILFIDKSWVNRVKEKMPILPKKRKEFFMKNYNLSDYDAEVLTIEKDFADYFEDVLNIIFNKEKNIDRQNVIKLVSNWFQVELLGRLNKENKLFSNNPIDKENFAELILFINSNKISGKIGKIIFDEMFKTSDKKPRDIIKEKNLIQITDEAEIEKIIVDILNKNPNLVADYKSGKTKVLGFFVGQIMQITKGKVNPSICNKILKRKLDE